MTTKRVGPLRREVDIDGAAYALAIAGRRIPGLAGSRKPQTAWRLQVANVPRCVSRAVAGGSIECGGRRFKQKLCGQSRRSARSLLGQFRQRWRSIERRSPATCRWARET
jgi:hypothetical protein